MLCFRRRINPVSVKLLTLNPPDLSCIHSTMANSNMNPYASYLGTRDPLEVVAATAGRLSLPVQALAPDGCGQPPNPRQRRERPILCGLADPRTAFAGRPRKGLSEHPH